MEHRRIVLSMALAGLLVVTITVTGSGVALAVQDTGQDAGTVLDDIEQLLQRIDEFLETVADLLRTIRAIGGEGGGD